MKQNQHKYVYKITNTQLWSEAKKSGTLQGMPIDIADGYMHFSTIDQLKETLRLHFRGQGDLMLLEIETKKVEKNLKWETSRGGALFPHLYAELKTNQILKAITIFVDDLGEVDLGDLI